MANFLADFRPSFSQISFEPGFSCIPEFGAANKSALFQGFLSFLQFRELEGDFKTRAKPPYGVRTKLQLKRFPNVQGQRPQETSHKFLHTSGHQIPQGQKQDSVTALLWELLGFGKRGLLEKGVFWKRGLFRKVHFIENLESLENPQIVWKTKENPTIF